MRTSEVRALLEHVRLLDEAGAPAGPSEQRRHTVSVAAWPRFARSETPHSRISIKGPHALAPLPPCCLAEQLRFAGRSLSRNSRALASALAPRTGREGDGPLDTVKALVVLP